MSELTLEALGYSHDEARIARRIHDFTHTPEQRAATQRFILASARAAWAPAFDPRALPAMDIGHADAAGQHKEPR